MNNFPDKGKPLSLRLYPCGIHVKGMRVQRRCLEKNVQLEAFYLVILCIYFFYFGHAGFLSVCDAIESLRQIGDTRSLLDKKKLQRDVKDICSKAVKPTDL